MTTVILNLHEQGYAVILMLDANSTIESEPHFSDFIDTCSFSDIHESNSAVSTFIGAEAWRMDYIFGCPQALQYLDRSGTLAYTEGPQSDHRGLYVNLDLHMFVGSKTPIAPSASRGVHTGNPELVEKYISKVLKYYEQHNMVDRILDHLYSNYTQSNDQSSDPGQSYTLGQWQRPIQQDNNSGR
jgi:hypothetical protein